MEKELYTRPLIRSVIIIVVACLNATGCERGSSDEISDNVTDPVVVRYNEEIKDLAAAVASAAGQNKSFRFLLKDEALKMFDGDYDILLRNIVDTRLEQPETMTKSSCDASDVRHLLNRHLGRTSSSVRLKSADSPVDELLGQYPDLQVAIPVHAEEWDPDSYIPAVTYIPADYDELTTTTVKGYTADGEEILIDAVNEPDEPVIVIGLNERSEFIDDPKAGVVPPAPYNLTGTATESGIRLNWCMPDTSSSANITGYNIYRKGSNDFAFVRHEILPGAYNRSYDDNNVEASRIYTYYVTAYFQAETSAPSNYLTVTAPALPKPVVSFDAIQHAKNEVELRWQSDYSQYIMETRVYKHVVDDPSGYVLLRSFTSQENDYFDRYITPGKKTIYKVCHVTALGESNPKYDFIQVPFRDISTGSPVYIKEIKFTDWSLERWFMGKPEFYITVTNVDPINKSPFKVQNQIDCEFNKREKSQIFDNVKVLDWQPGFWYDMLTFTALEYDKPLGELHIKIGVGFNTKDLLKLSFLQGTAGVEYEITFKNDGNECGNSYLNYFENPETWIIFPNYGLQIRVSENN